MPCYKCSNGSSGTSGSSGSSGTSGTSGVGFNAIISPLDNSLLTSNGSSTSAVSEANLTFDGTQLLVTGSIFVSNSLSSGTTFTASLQEGYTFVGGNGNISKLVSTSSFGGGVGGGHIIEDSGSALTQRAALNFVRMTLSDDAVNDATVVVRPPSTTVSSTAPTNPLEGDEWIDSDTWKKYVWYLNAGGTDYWVEVGTVPSNGTLIS